MRSLIKDFRILNDEVLEDKVLSEKSFFKTRFATPARLYDSLTWLTTNYWKETPLTMMTIGSALMGKKGARRGMSEKEINGFEYEFDIMGEIDKNDIISSGIYAPGDTPGIGHSTFKMRFKTNWFPKGYVIESGTENKVQVRIDSEPQPFSNEWEYTVRLVHGDASAFCPLDALEPGTIWTCMFSPHSESGSEAPGSFGRILPGKAQGCITRLRQSYAWKGNVANRYLNIQVPKSGGGMTKVLMEYDLMMMERRWALEKETLMMYSEYNRLPDGTYSLREPNSGDVIKIGAGLLQQIPNVYSSSNITFNKLQTMIYDVFAQHSSNMGKKVILMTGLGGLIDFNNAMENKLGTSYQWNTTNDKKVIGSGHEMGLSGYFTRVQFIGDFEVKVVYNHLFDFGKRASAAPKHPVTGRSLESHRMIFLDDSSESGESNLTYIYEKGTKNGPKYKFIAGMNPMPKSLVSADPQFISSEKDESSLHRSETCGIQMRYPQRSLHIEPTLA